MPETFAVEIPPALYVLVGFLVITNIGAIVTLITFIFKVGMFVAETKAGIDDAKSRANRAHARITEHERGHDGQSI